MTDSANLVAQKNQGKKELRRKERRKKMAIMTGAVKEQSPLKQILRICSINHQLLLPEKLERPGSIWYQRMVPIGNQSLRTDLIRMAIQRESSLLKAEARRKEAINRSRTPTPSLQSLLICRVPLAPWKGPTGLPQLLRFVQRSNIFDSIDQVSNSSTSEHLIFLFTRFDCPHDVSLFKTV